jgi:iron complex outermembrane receptor protein
MLALCSGAHADDSDTVVVSVSRVAQQALQTAASVDLIDAAKLRDGQAQAQLAEGLARSPGIFAIDRNNHAQDPMISSRGFGANSPFGARGIRIIVDGIPATSADGQSQTAHIDLPSAARVEVLRGPFSTLYGNASGGVIQVFSERGGETTQLTPYLHWGAWGQRREGIKLSGPLGGADYVADAGRLTSEGYRQHSAAKRENWNLVLGGTTSGGLKWRLVGNGMSLEAQDPLGLSAAQLAVDRRQAGSYAEAYDTRKTVRQTQGGLRLNQPLDADGEVALALWQGQRDNRQYQSGRDPGGRTAASNGVIDLGRDFRGAHLLLTRRGQLAERPLSYNLGVETSRSDDLRRTFNNVGGIAQAPTAFNQFLDQDAKQLDMFGQAEWWASDTLALHAGLRRSQITLASRSRNGGSGSGSGERDYRALTGLTAVQWFMAPGAQVYLSLGSSFDTPTLNQTANSPAFLAGQTPVNAGNFALDAARTTQTELGYKRALGTGGSLRAALFAARTRDDIVIAVSNAGRTAFTNAPRTQRDGAELALDLPLSPSLQASAALTWLDARIAAAYTSLWNGQPQRIADGQRIPGVPARSAFAELRWRSPEAALEAALEARAAGALPANDANSAQAPGYATLALRMLARQSLGRVQFSQFLRVDNLFDKQHVASVIVNQSSAQFYEPAPGRRWMGGVNATLSF